MQKKPKEFLLTPKEPEIIPGKDIPSPEIQPEHPLKIVPVEEPLKTPQPEIEPGKEPA